MLKYILKRIAYMFITLWLIVTLTFVVMKALPGDPIAAKYEKSPKEVQQNLSARYGLDKPIYIQYIKYIGNISKGDLGESIETPGRKANSIIKETFPVSARLGLQAITIGLAIGLALGIIAAFKRNTWIDYLVMFIAIVGVSVPSFVLASILQYTFSYKVPILPPVGWPTRDVWTSGFKYTILPTIALGFATIAIYGRYMRASVLDVINQDYILTAKAKGVPRGRLIWKHVMRNSLLPIITVLGSQIAALLVGAFVIEYIFSIPGMGQYFVSSIGQRDYTMIMATTIFYSLLFIFSLIFVDLLYGIIDPRIRITGHKK